jgi:hypothetical protein
VTARTVRRIVVLLCVAGVAGLIVTSILDAQAAAVTIGLLTAAAVLCLIVATAVTQAPLPHARPAFDEEQAERVEALVADLITAGADEAALRCLVREAVHLGRGGVPQPSTRAADEEVWQQQ